MMMTSMPKKQFQLYCNKK